jgi:hypothetical protein
MKTTTRLYDIIYSTYNNIYSDFLRNHQIIYFNPELQFTHKVIDYDEEVKNVCRNTIFYGIDFLDETPRNRFEQEFLTRFLSRTIKFQTYELFNWKLVAYLRGVKEIITDYYTNANKYLQGYSLSNASGNSNSQGESLTRDNNLAVTLPQDNTDLSLDKDTYDYADTTAHSKSRATNTTAQNTTQTNDTISYDVARLSELQAYHDDLFNDLDRLLFSQMM